MSSSPATTRPTLFLSYASEDRDAVKLIRDALELAGLDVWYDENELGGGDAWDQKIRRQIRDCDYFMAVVSANTERRREGYFRREWRLAVERSLDMADDVMFLLPVTLDSTSENGARVPEKFLTVQWLRLPEGRPSAALRSLAERLARGDHTPPPPPLPPRIRSTRTASSPSAPTQAHPEAASPDSESNADGPPPMPPFPHLAPEPHFGQFMKFLAEIIWWVLTATWLLLKRAPRWVRVLFTIWVVFVAFARCNSDDPPAAAKPARERPAEKSTAEKSPPPTQAETRATLEAAAKELKALSTDRDQPAVVNKFAQFGEELARNLAAQLKDSANTGKQLLAVPFALGVTPEADAKLLGDIFVPLYGRLALALPDETGLINTALPAVNDESLVALGKQLSADYVLGAQLLTINGPTLRVKLMKIEDASVAWTADYAVTDRNPADVATEIATAVLAASKAPAAP